MSDRSAARVFPEPPSWFSSLRCIGVTGTNGKTSTTRLLAAALSAPGAPVLSTTTLGSFLDVEPLATRQTFQGFLDAARLAVDRGARFCVMELTSEVLARGFTRSIPCEVGVFTNLTHDHLDAHGSAEHYLASKAQLFLTLPAGGHAVLNAADPASALLTEVVPKGVRTLCYAVASRGEVILPAELVAGHVTLDWSGTTVRFERAPAGLLGELTTRAVGEMYAENALAATLAALAVGVRPDDVVRRIRECAPPAGRFERVASLPDVVVDYAHSPDALVRTLATARRLTRGKVVLVFGAGGNRDAGKRRKMGEAAYGADRVLLTSDNPRDEDPAVIVSHLKSGLEGHPEVDVLLDRRQAIFHAVQEAQPADLVLVAGKGHEETQVTQGKAERLSDRVVAEAAHVARMK